jgi:uncharacterized membrane protein
MSLPLIEHVERDGFRLRGLSPSRIDSFSDSVFAFALTLLIVSVAVPRTYDDLAATLRGFPAFAICFYLLMLVWMSHYRFFRRFGTHDDRTIGINSALLFVVLFYVYPLKFLFTVAIHSGAEQQTGHQLKHLMMLYGFGYAAIYLLIAALYRNGLRQSEHLQLSALECLLTRGYIADAAAIATVGLLSSLAAFLLPEGEAGWAGLAFALVSISRPIMRRIQHRRVSRFHAMHRITDTPKVSPSLQA